MNFLVLKRINYKDVKLKFSERGNEREDGKISSTSKIEDGEFISNKNNISRLFYNMEENTDKSHFPVYTDKRCWWCRNRFESSPLGLPLEMVKKRDDVKFVTEGIFCSFECCKAYIIDCEKNNPSKYKNSISLLDCLYRHMYKEDRKIQPAPSWKLLKEYGGVMGIQEFRQNSKKLIYSDIPSMKKPVLFPSSSCVMEF